MRIVVALDSFKGSLDAVAACNAAVEGLRSILHSAEIAVHPMADGGEGTAAVMLASRRGSWIPVKTTGPLPGMKVDAGFGLFEDGTAIVEMAAASGLTLLRDEQRNPLLTTTFGTGELLRAAGEKGAQKILLAVGGSATVDGGAGAASALGWTFTDKQTTTLRLGGGFLEQLHSIIRPKALGLPVVEVLCDVDNPLCGEQGAARVFGPQKGATPEMVAQLEAGLQRLADVVEATLGCRIHDLPGGGAAGGLAAGAVAFMGAKLVSGVDAVVEATRLDDALKGVDWVVTGEGRFDSQSLRGKVVAGVVRAAKRAGVRVAVVAGSVALSQAEHRACGVEFAVAAKPDTMPLADAMAKAPELVKQAGKTLGGLL